MGKTIGVPNLFEAIPLQDGISLLLSRKEQEYQEIKKKTEQLIEQARCCIGGVIEEQEKDFHITPKKTIFIRGALIHMQNAQWGNDTISSLKRFSQAMVYSFETHKRALERGVKHGLLWRNLKMGKFFSRDGSDSYGHQNFELRYTPTCLKRLEPVLTKKPWGYSWIL